MAFLTVEKLGPTQSMTPEGFLLCAGVAIARTGRQTYSTKEIPLDGDADDMVSIEREAAEVFKSETLASFEGKPVTINHPDTFVNPSNWASLAKGVTQNVRQGSGVDDDLLLADLLITDSEAIKEVRGKDLREVSCGYEADYEQITPGKGRQINIIGNHVALVERGRAGPRCSIKDEDIKMQVKPKSKLSFIDKLRKFLDTEGEEFEKKIDDEVVAENLEAEDEDEIGARLTRIEDTLTKLMGTADEDEPDDEETTDEDEEEAEEEETTDDVLEAEKAQVNPQAKGTVQMGDTLKNVIARAEVLAPGIHMPTGDAAKKGNAVSMLKRKALSAAFATQDGKKMVTPFLGGREIKTLTGDALNAVFAGAYELAKATNNNKGMRKSAATNDFSKPATIADINARNKAHWAQQ